MRYGEMVTATAHRSSRCTELLIIIMILVGALLADVSSGFDVTQNDLTMPSRTVFTAPQTTLALTRASQSIHQHADSAEADNRSRKFKVTMRLRGGFYRGDGTFLEMGFLVFYASLAYFICASVLYILARLVCSIPSIFDAHARFSSRVPTPIPIQESTYVAGGLRRSPQQRRGPDSKAPKHCDERRTAGTLWSRGFKCGTGFAALLASLAMIKIKMLLPTGPSSRHGDLHGDLDTTHLSNEMVDGRANLEGYRRILRSQWFEVEPLKNSQERGQVEQEAATAHTPAFREGAKHIESAREPAEDEAQFATQGQELGEPKAAVLLGEERNETGDGGTAARRKATNAGGDASDHRPLHRPSRPQLIMVSD